MAERESSYSADKQGFFKVVGPDIARPLDGSQEGWEVVVDTPELARKREANRNRIEHNVFTYTGHEHPAGWYPALWQKPGGGRGKESTPTKRPPGYSKEFWAIMQKQNRKWTSDDMTLKKK